MSGHTKGPFEVRKDGFDDTFYLRREGAEDDGMFTVERIVAERISKESDANLFAAAPELLEALEIAYSMAGLFNRDSDDVWVSAKKKIEAAIAKARGEV